MSLILIVLVVGAVFWAILLVAPMLRPAPRATQGTPEHPLAGNRAVLSETDPAPGDEHIVEWWSEVSDPAVVRDLQAALYNSDVAAFEAVSGPDISASLVDRFEGLRIEVFSREHPPPHFRVSASGPVANYRISDCEQLNGGLRTEYKAVREWHRKNKHMLIASWNRLRPSGCPVGEYREP